MKKIAAITLLLGIGFLSLFNLNNPSTEKSDKHKFIAFGKVDFSDDSDNEYDDTDDDSYSEDWFEHFVKTHKTPFSKTIQK